MNNDRFRDKMKQLEQERDEFVEKLTPEGQQEYQQKKEEFNHKRTATPDVPANSQAQE
jgi:hypothetical protein